MNGDGYDDIVGFAGKNVEVAFSNGDGTFARTKVALRGHFGRESLGVNNSSPRMLGNLNGDKYADIIGFTQKSIDVALGGGRLKRAAEEAKNRFINSQVSASQKMVHLIEVDNTSLNFGDIVITGGYLKGTGILDASANSKVNIHNSSDASLKVNDIDISSMGGGLYFNYREIKTNNSYPILNAAINQYNPSAHQANFGKVQTLATTGRPEVDIRSTSGSRTVIQLNGEINNIQGKIRAHNAAGDTFVSGRLRARTIDISTGGNFIQSYTNGVSHLGGDPYSLWKNTVEASVKAGKTKNQGRSRGDSSIIADNVFIAGEIINVNGLIQAGSAIQGTIIHNNADFKAAVNTFNAQYQRNPSKYLFDFKSEGNGIEPAGSKRDKLVRLQWNARDQKIEVRSLNVEGGALELHGRIVSTGSGKLKVLDGYSRINIFNHTQYDLKLATLNSNAVEGRIKITDTSRTGNSPYGFHVTEITRIGDSIQTTINGESSKVSGRSTQYATRSNQVYRFDTYRDYQTTSYWKKEQGGTGFDWASVVYWTKYNARGSDTTKPIGLLTLIPNSSRLETRAQASDYTFSKGDAETLKTWSGSTRYQGHKNGGTYRSWHYEKYRNYRQQYIHRLKADYAIDIEFIGNDRGSVRVESRQSQVILDGTLTNLGGKTQIVAKRITGAHSQVSIRSQDIDLEAGSIGAFTIETPAETGSLSALANSGDLELRHVGGSIKNASIAAAGGGDVVFSAVGDIQSGIFMGKRISLSSSQGGISARVYTGDRSDVGTETTDPKDTSLTAIAKGDIEITEVTDDLRVKQVKSLEGNVTLIAEKGSLIDGQTHQSNLPGTLNSLKAFADDAAVAAHIQAYETARQADYRTYWQIRNQLGDTFDPKTYRFTYSNKQRAQLKADGKTDAQITAMEDSQTQWVKQRHADFGGQSVYDPNYVFRISQAKRDQLKQSLSNQLQTLDQQLKLFGDSQALEYVFGLLNGNVGLGSEKANAIGRDITLHSKHGSVGGAVGSQPFSVNRAQLLKLLTPTQQETLSQALAKGLIQQKGDNILITPKEDFDVTATGAVKAVSSNVTNPTASNVYLGSTGSIAIKEINAARDVYLLSNGAITDANGTANNITYGANLLVLPKSSQSNLGITKKKS